MLSAGFFVDRDSPGENLGCGKGILCHSKRAWPKAKILQVKMLKSKTPADRDTAADAPFSAIRVSFDTWARGCSPCSRCKCNRWQLAGRFTKSRTARWLSD